MGNANGRDSGGVDDLSPGRSNGETGFHGDPPSPNPEMPGRVVSSDVMGSTPPESPRRSRSPVMFPPQAPVAPLQRGGDGSPLVGPIWQNESCGVVDCPPERGIPTIITWAYGGNNVAVEGSWDNWASRRTLQKTGKDQSVLLVLPSGVYHYKFIVDGECRYIPDLPFMSDDMGRVHNLLDVHDYVPDNLESVAELETPQSPDSSYSQAFPGDEDFAKEPAAVPSQLHLTVLGTPNLDEVGIPLRPQHVVLNHLFIEKGGTSQSIVAMGLTHRFQSKYVTVVLYKPQNR